MAIPADRTFVDQGRAIIDPWLKVIERHDKKVDDLETRMTAAEVPDETTENENSFGRVEAYNDTVEIDGDPLSADEPGDTLLVNVNGSGNLETTPSTNGLSLSVCGHSGVIPDIGVGIATMGLSSLTNGSASLNTIYAAPIEIPSRRSLTYLGWYCRVPGGGDPDSNWAMSIHTDLNSKPAHQLATTGTIYALGNLLEVITSAISLTLPGGRYWLLWTAAATYDVRASVPGIGSMGVRATDFVLCRGYSRAATFNGILTDETGSVWTPNYGTNVPAMLAG